VGVPLSSQLLQGCVGFITQDQGKGDEATAEQQQQYRSRLDYASTRRKSSDKLQMLFLIGSSDRKALFLFCQVSSVELSIKKIDTIPGLLETQNYAG
jgi:hypothetical protein